MGLGLRASWRKFRRYIERPDERRIAAYLAGPGDKRLHIGCGEHLLPGWLNCDLLEGWLNDRMMRGSIAVVNLNAVKPYPFADNTFDYIFSEHMIEHVSYAEGGRMLAECFRVLKPGGVVRITTPDLRFLIDLYGREPGEYSKWSASSFANVIGTEPVYVINNFVRAWGHQFIYDELALRRQLETARFVECEVCALGESDHAALRGLEREERMPPGFLRLESISVEATKP